MKHFFNQLLLKTVRIKTEVGHVGERPEAKNSFCSLRNLTLSCICIYMLLTFNDEMHMDGI